MQKIQFDYFTGMEAEQYSFYRVPKVLFTESCFKALTETWRDAAVSLAAYLQKESVQTMKRRF